MSINNSIVPLINPSLLNNEQAKVFSQVVSFREWPTAQETHLRAVQFIYGVLTNEFHKYSIVRGYTSSKPVWPMMNHPFRHDPALIVSFVGSPGVSSSVGKFIQVVTSKVISARVDVNEKLERQICFRVWACACEQGHDIIMEVGNFWNSYLVGGMTNYSGEAGKAFKDMLSVLYHWAYFFDRPVEYYLVSKEALDGLEEEIYKSEIEKEMMEENDAN